MGRHEYAEDGSLDTWEFIRWRGRVASATRGRRGQRLLHELLDALDAMPEKRIITGDLVSEDGDCCTIGVALAARKGIEEASKWDAEGNNGALAAEFDVAECLVQEIEWMNDEGAYNETTESRWQRMRNWVVSQLKAE